MYIYVASSWRNGMQPAVVVALRAAGHKVYDFKKPDGENAGFHWSDIDPEWQKWTPREFIKALDHPLAVEGYERDAAAIAECGACVLVLPCGRSAHFEAGEFRGEKKQTHILLSDGGPELMYRGATSICCHISEVIENLEE